MTAPRRKKLRLLKLLVLGGLVGAAFSYRERRLARAPEPSWDNPDTRTAA